MRKLTCAPWLALCAVPILAQTPPGCQKDVNRVFIERAMPAVAPGLAAPVSFAIVPPGGFVTALTPPARQSPANPSVIRRAIRALASRVLPAKLLSGSTPTTPAHAGRTLIAQPMGDADFLFVMGKRAAPDPCPAASGRAY